jgi:hypothetical protein
MKDNKYRLFLYKPAAANFVVDSAEYRAEFLGELKVDNLQTNIKLQEISTLSFTLPESILGELNTRIDEVLDSYVVELWYGKLEGNLGADYFPEQGSRIRFIITKSILNYNDGIKTYSYEADSLEYILEFKHIFNWPGIKVKDYYRTIRYDKQLEKFVEVESTGSSGYTISTSTNTNQTKYITVPTTYGKTMNAPDPFEIFLYQYRRNTEDTVNSENSIVEFSRGVNDEFFKEGFYVPVLNSEGKVTDLNIALPNNIADFGSSNPSAIFEMFLYDNPLSRKIATVTESTNENNEPAAQVILTAQNVETKFTILAEGKNNSNILITTRSSGSRLEAGQKIKGTGIVSGTLITEVNIDRSKALVTISNNYLGPNKKLIFEIISENIIYITPPTPPLEPVIEYSFSSQLIYSINGLKLEHALLGTQETRNQLNEIDNSVLNVDGILYDTGFSIGVIHPEIAEKFRSNIELKNITGYQAIKNLAESFDAIVVYDSINKTVSFYPDKNEEVFVNNGLIITKQNYLKSITNDINATKVITKAYAAGKDNVGIELINPTGGAAWEDYSYFLDTYYVKFDKNNLLAFTQNSETGITFTSFPVGTLARWIEAAEASKLAQWQYARDYFHAILLGDLVSSISAYNTRYYNFYKLRDETLSKFVKEETRYYELKASEYKYKYIYEYYIKLNKNTPTTESPQLEIDYKKKYDDAVDASAEALKEINKLHYNLFNTRIDGTIAANGDSDFSELDTIAQNSFASKISEIQSFLDKAKWQINLEKLKVFEKDSVMTDSKIDNQFDLLEALETFVKENCVPVVTLQIDVVDFLASYQSKVDWDKVKIGDIVNIYYPDFNIDTSAQIREISIDFQSNSLQFVISTYRQYSQLPLSYIAKQIRNTYDNNTNKLLYSHDNDSYSNDVVEKINEQVEEKGFEASTTKITFGARALSGETSSEISEDGIVSNVIGVDPLLEVFIYSQEKTLTIADGTLTAKNIVKVNDVLQYTSEVEVSGDNGFVIRKIQNNGVVIPQVYIDTNGNAVFAGTLEVGSSAYNQVVALAGDGTTVFSAGSLEEFNLITTANVNDILLITESFNIGATLYVKDDVYKYVNNNWVIDLDLSNKITGSVGGWKIDSTSIKSSEFILQNDSTNPYLSIKQSTNPGWYNPLQVSPSSNKYGIFLGYDNNLAKMSLASETNYLVWNGSDLLLKGNLSGEISALEIQNVRIDSEGIKGFISKNPDIFSFYLNSSNGKGLIGGWTFDSEKISSELDVNNNPNIILNKDGWIGLKKNSYQSVTSGAFLGIDTLDNKAKFNVGNDTRFLKWTGEELEVNGDIGGTIGNITVGNISITSNGIKGTNDGTTKTFELRSDSGAGFIGGFSFDNQKLTATNLTLLGGTNPYLYFGSDTTPAFSDVGIFAGISDGNTKMSLVTGSTFLKYDPSAIYNLEIAGNAKIGPLFVGNTGSSFISVNTGNGGLTYHSGSNPLNTNGQSVTLNITNQTLEITGVSLNLSSWGGGFVDIGATFYDGINGGGNSLGSESSGPIDDINVFIDFNLRTVLRAKSVVISIQIFSTTASLPVSGISLTAYMPSLQVNDFNVNSIGQVSVNNLTIVRRTFAPSQDRMIFATTGLGNTYKSMFITGPTSSLTANRIIRFPDTDGTLAVLNFISLGSRTAAAGNGDLTVSNLSSYSNYLFEFTFLDGGGVLRHVDTLFVRRSSFTNTNNRYSLQTPGQTARVQVAYVNNTTVTITFTSAGNSSTTNITIFGVR